MKSLEELRRQTEEIIRAERELRLDRDARAKRDGAILDAFDRLQRGDGARSDEEPPRRHPPTLTVVP